ncbi:hypothetical protein N2152v2_008375 [Parachlorella kessleri]
MSSPKESDAAPLPVFDSVSEYKARDRKTGDIVALKRLRMDRERDGMPVTSVRELRVLQTCRHPNLVSLLRVVTGPTLDSVFLVFEYCSHDLGRLVDSLRHPFHQSEVKCLLQQVQWCPARPVMEEYAEFVPAGQAMKLVKLWGVADSRSPLEQRAHGAGFAGSQQLLQAVAYLHDHWVTHRDLKLSNLLYTNDGKLKLCDFGLARYFQPYEERYTPGVITLWYRAPEVLLGCETYTESVDLWGVGCIFAELLKNEPLFPAKTEVSMLEMMCSLLGTPNDRIWPGLPSMPHAATLTLPYQPYNFLKKEFSMLSEAGVDLMNKLLTYDPAKRITARQALRHPYFSERPLPRQPQYMPSFPSAHDEHASKAGQGKTHLQRRREAEEAHGRGIKRRYYADHDDKFGDAFAGDARVQRRPAVVRRCD